MIQISLLFLALAGFANNPGTPKTMPVTCLTDWGGAMTKINCRDIPTSTSGMSQSSYISNVCVFHDGIWKHGSFGYLQATKGFGMMHMHPCQRGVIVKTAVPVYGPSIMEVGENLVQKVGENGFKSLYNQSPNNAPKICINRTHFGAKDYLITCFPPEFEGASACEWIDVETAKDAGVTNAQKSYANLAHFTGKWWVRWETPEKKELSVCQYGTRSF